MKKAALEVVARFAESINIFIRFIASLCRIIHCYDYVRELSSNREETFEKKSFSRVSRNSNKEDIQLACTNTESTREIEIIPTWAATWREFFARLSDRSALLPDELITIIIDGSRAESRRGQQIVSRVRCARKARIIYRDTSSACDRSRERKYTPVYYLLRLEMLKVSFAELSARVFVELKKIYTFLCNRITERQTQARAIPRITKRVKARARCNIPLIYFSTTYNSVVTRIACRKRVAHT